MSSLCPCTSELDYEQCCGNYIETDAFAPTPEALMRSRYTAHVLGKVSYLEKTMKGLPFDAVNTGAWLQESNWNGLQVIQTRSKSDTIGFVTFIAHYTYQNKKLAICEKSEFHKIGEQWFYVGGKTLNPNKKWS